MIQVAACVPFVGPAWQVLAGKLSHVALYSMLIVLPGTGIAMNWVSGRGVPFFNTTFDAPFAIEKNPAIAKQAFWVHSKTGQVLEYVVPVHIGAVGYHALKGTNILKRLWPFA
jgi:cytochrome b561